MDLPDRLNTSADWPTPRFSPYLSSTAAPGADNLWLCPGPLIPVSVSHITANVANRNPPSMLPSLSQYTVSQKKNWTFFHLVVVVVGVAGAAANSLILYAMVVSSLLVLCGGQSSAQQSILCCPILINLYGCRHKLTATIVYPKIYHHTPNLLVH